ncbi:hypothetical protein ABNB59_11260 [Paenibacillus larvae]|uniref:Uncharacterized protein n=5 Tax=Paenibacillus larvae TaxID=1464 RepID=V9WB45_9BACL|nr:hypothetical protein [Paenibacillus larvae]AHD07104.1 hypothetical protein ERIC2_c33670 [Paenibacillus larvae subsp. larvae DSM 25430]AQR78094.1 hypothetical protein BXP28_12925 [Paenibacillus larvae subsp. larvae]AVF20731.1 hypothetical protein ERICI_00818 [Paenibacillus larvae subsp. larvae]AVG13668.1 hypothetical protein ERICII_03360 [Paenibacillus larvae subsp. larvae DSM 25430]ETK28304.1 hypothetical protein ERIC1_1c17660 [Paenibacillus larvae subsp. larvae DSM 25719]
MNAKDLFLSDKDIPETIKVHFLVTSTLKCYKENFERAPDLLPGTKIEILASSTTGKHYAHLVLCTAKMLPGSSKWEHLIKGEKHGFVDLGFEIGVMPHNRSLVTGIGK